MHALQATLVWKWLGGCSFFSAFVWERSPTQEEEKLLFFSAEDPPPPPFPKPKKKVKLAWCKLLGKQQHDIRASFFTRVAFEVRGRQKKFFSSWNEGWHATSKTTTIKVFCFFRFFRVFFCFFGNCRTLTLMRSIRSVFPLVPR